MRGDQHAKRFRIAPLGGWKTRIYCGHGDHAGLFTPSLDWQKKVHFLE
jgi:hypothetical protein